MKLEKASMISSLSGEFTQKDLSYDIAFWRTEGLSKSKERLISCFSIPPIIGNLTAVFLCVSLEKVY